MSNEQAHHTLTKKRAVLFGAGSVMLLIIIVLLITLLTAPTRSVEAFCNTFRQENTRLADSQGDTYSVKPFAHNSSNPRDFAIAFGKLERVAPADIQSDVKTLKQIFEKIDQDPAQALSASMSGLSAESSVDKWTAQHCKE